MQNYVSEHNSTFDSFKILKEPFLPTENVFLDRQDKNITGSLLVT